MKIAVFGAGSWGFCLAQLLAHKGHSISVWTRNQEFAEKLTRTGIHPKFPRHPAAKEISFSSDLADVLSGSEFLVEAVTSVGIRPLFSQIAKLQKEKSALVVITSKGIEKDTGLFLPELVSEILGASDRVGSISGPTHAEEVIDGKPASLICSAYLLDAINQIKQLFSTPFFHLFPNEDIRGVALGGAMKNIIAIASGISDGLGYGDNAKAALVTRGVEEIKKVAPLKNAKPETLDGLAGLGDICATCFSNHSRNYRFGYLLAQGNSVVKAQEKIGMMVEGIYTAASAFQLAQRGQIVVPIVRAVYELIYNHADPRAIFQNLFRGTELC